MNLSRFLLLSVAVLLVTLAIPSSVSAQTTNSNPPTRVTTTPISPTPVTQVISPPEASATAEVATPAADVIQKIEEKNAQDLTATSLQQKERLAAYLDENPAAPLSWYNFIQHGIRDSISKGLPGNIIVLILLFPVITSIIAASRHIVGLKGFGVYTPAVLAVAFVSTGIPTGIAMFLVVLAAAVLSRSLVKKLELQYLPRTAMLLWGVSILVLAFLITTSYLRIELFLAVSIFPLLIMMLLTENFMETQLSSTQSQALQMTAETLFIAIVCSLIIGSDAVQQWVILNPEITIILVAVFNIIVGRYTGLRLMEYIRFRPLLNE